MKVIDSEGYETFSCYMKWSVNALLIMIVNFRLYIKEVLVFSKEPLASCVGKM